ncbi:lytic transglycosylase domain-containing protein [Rhodovulum sp. 12E13]|uniref:lytic transglycosylase domain-containing protein n=1 Tax=Rhodovulum sp. 12E13 TaxID=2203891 RepID=UPI000E119E61|nr:lytic transglycosylase domain-containing protein [Rhodovulum sp. 12E13]RDC73804.1 lytic transglycosylase domain-containing protein [Rhodovulum sp. 12E13]
MRRFALASCVAVFALAGSAPAADAPAPELADAMRLAFEKVRADDWRAADVAALPAGAVGRDIVEWYRLRDGEGDFEDYLSFLERRADWPDLLTIRRNAEGAIRPETRPEAVLAFFAGHEPATGSGVVRLVSAHESLGHTGDAMATAVKAWLTLPLGAGAEAELLSRYADELAPFHEQRMDAMLWAGNESAWRRMIGRVDEGWLRLAEARQALDAQAPGVDARIEAVPAALQDHPGLAYERFNWRARKGRREDAIALMLERSTGPEALGRPERWANWRRIYARMLMREGAALEAYTLASRHFLVEGAHFADLEWLSGFLALRFLDDPELALFHFDRFAMAVETPISLGRAGYWRGRAYEALGEEENAETAYRAGAEHQTSFYGLLAAEAAGVDLDPALSGGEEFPTFDEAGLADNSVWQAADLFLAGGEPWRAEQFLRHLGRTLPREAAGAVADVLLGRGEAHIALRMAKAAAGEGRVLHAAYFPIAEGFDGDLPVERALALAVARRESEFDPVVVSPAGARGIMQLMPGTASDVSRELGLSYSRDGLTEDAAYNVRLGTAYLAGLIDSFGPAPVLVAVGYNAGPGRAIDWRATFGDPRDESVDLVDWIELIPFRETRNYVMRVTESVMVYRARLSGETGPVRMLDYLRNG